MFTGIVETIGHIAAAQRKGGDLRLKVATGELDMSDVRIGDSIATNGVCLTVTDLSEQAFWADVSLESIHLTTLGNLSPGTKVNLEKALQVGSRLGGHLVSGHVDGVGDILSVQQDARSVRFKVKAPEELARYIAYKGSICIDGTSLTVTGVSGAEFELSIVPHTAACTIMADYRVGTRVNLEVDQIARYLERLLTSGSAEPPAVAGKSKLNEAFLAENGFLGRIKR